MPTAAKPNAITLRCYNVGFGDCFLLTFHYKTASNNQRDRHILIDFGSTGAPKAFAKQKSLLLDIAKDIEHVCEGKLDAVVATHRHKDHISGFSTLQSGKGSGDVIRSLKPDVVIQPWTEDPDAEPDALEPVNAPGMAKKNFVGALRNMHQVAQMALDASRLSAKWYPRDLQRQLGFLGDDNLANKSAVDNLMTMGHKSMYVHFDSKSGLEKILPGVTTRVLGPPTLRQSETIRKQRSTDKDEFWHFSRFWGLQAMAAGRVSTGKALFARAATIGSRSAPPETRWFLKRARALQGDQLLGIVRALDKAMNNTSVILLFETAGKRLLFPGDAQIENWSFALQTLKDRNERGLLEQVDVYKVGHHGSLNATPKSLFNSFKKRGPATKKNRLSAVMSTLPGKHGSKSAGTEVPRSKLVTALSAETTLFSTESMKKKDGLAHIVTIPLP
jgi:hypothetical protein